MAIVVPHQMLEAACDEWRRLKCECECVNEVRLILESALAWLAENPMVPTLDQARDMSGFSDGRGQQAVQVSCAEWQRRMFLAPEPKAADPVLLLKGILHAAGGHEWGYYGTYRGKSITLSESQVAEIQRAVDEADRRGKEGR